MNVDEYGKILSGISIITFNKINFLEVVLQRKYSRKEKITLNSRIKCTKQKSNYEQGQRTINLYINLMQLNCKEKRKGNKNSGENESSDKKPCGITSTDNDGKKDTEVKLV